MMTLTNWYRYVDKFYMFVDLRLMNFLSSARLNRTRPLVRAAARCGSRLAPAGFAPSFTYGHWLRPFSSDSGVTFHRRWLDWRLLTYVTSQISFTHYSLSFSPSPHTSVSEGQLCLKSVPICDHTLAKGTWCRSVNSLFLVLSLSHTCHLIKLDRGHFSYYNLSLFKTGYEFVVLVVVCCRMLLTRCECEWIQNSTCRFSWRDESASAVG